MMNLPLLYRASAHTGYEHYFEIATSHADTTAEYAVRDDGSTAHGISFDVETGEFQGQRTYQGLADDSCWSRGQAWTIYGFALAYRHTGAEQFRKTARLVADYYLEEVPNDWVPAWDFDAEDSEIRDSSAAAIAACGLLELAGQLPSTDQYKEHYENSALATLSSLSTDYTTTGVESNGILAEGTYDRNEGGYDRCTLWGDYYFLEGLVRATRHWTPWWARNADKRPRHNRLRP
jgi:unsaturated chondroitin disaccharide hydrolase